MIAQLISWIVGFIFGALIMAAVLWALRILWRALVEGVDWVSGGGDPFA